MRPVTGITAALVLGALAAGLCVACGAGARDRAASADARTDAADETACPLDWPGGFRARPAAKWVRSIVEQAGYEVVDELPAALVAAGRGHEFFVWAVQDTPSDPHLADPDEFEVVARVGGLAVYGHAGAVDWWPSRGFHVWIERGPNRGPRRVSVAPRPDEIAPLVEASKRIPAPRPCG